MRINIKLHPGSSQEKIKCLADNSYEVWIKQKPIENKANKALEKFLKKHFKKNVKIVSGLKSKKKVVDLN